MYDAERLHLLAESMAFVILSLSFRKKGDYLHPFNLICYLFTIQYLIPAILLIAQPASVFGERWGLLDEIMSVAGWALLTVNIFVLMLALGFQKKLPVPVLKGAWDWNEPQLKYLSGLLFLLFLGLMGYYAIVAGGAVQLTTSFYIARGTGWINILVLMSSHLIPMVLWSAGKRRSAFFSAGLIFLFLMLSGGRLASVVSLFWFLLFIYYLDGTDWIRWLLLALPLLLPLSIYVLLKPYFEDVPLSSILAYDWRHLFLSEVGRLEQLSVYLWYSLRHGEFMFGKPWVLSLLGPFLSGTVDYIDYRNVISARVFGLDPATFRTGMGGSGVADLWINGGPAALIIGPVIYGIGWRTAYDYMQRNSTAFATLLYINVSAFFYQAIQEMLSFGILYYTILPLLAFSVACGVHCLNPRERQVPLTVAAGA